MIFSELRQVLEEQRNRIDEQLAALTNLEAALGRARSAFGLPGTDLCRPTHLNEWYDVHSDREIPGHMRRVRTMAA
jgi:hypothetical protein